MDDRLKPDYVFIGDGKGKVTRVDLPIKDITEDVKPNPYHIGEHLGDGDMEFLKDSYDAVGYIPPIELFYRDYSMQMEKRIEDTVLKAVLEIGVNIDKERLIKILDGDRKSYEDGYRNGFEDGQKSVTEKNTRWKQWLQNLIGDDRRSFVCGKYRHCGDCMLYIPCMVEHTEEDFNKNREEFDQAIDEWLDTEIEEGNDDGE